MSVPLVLVAHGSRDARSVTATGALVGAVAAIRPGLDVRAAFLDHAWPPLTEVLGALSVAGHRRAAVVPLLLTAAYHRWVDIPRVVVAAGAADPRLAVRVADVLGPGARRVEELLLAGLHRRLAEAGAASDTDGVVLAAAGTRDAAARETVDRAAASLGVTLGVPCLAAYASAAGPTADVAVARLRSAGAKRVAMAAYFMAPGRLYEQASAAARAAGVDAVAAPLAGAPEIARLVLARADALSWR